MGVNFHTAWVADTLWKPTSMNPVPAALDKGITYLKNVIVHCDGTISYVKATGVLTWSGVLRILFNKENGDAVQNTVNAGNITLADNEFAYVDLNETNDTVIAVGKAAVTTASASNFMAVNRLVLAYRNTTSDELYFVYLPIIISTDSILDNSVTNAKLAQMATKTYKGRTSAGTGNAEDVSVATVKTDLVLVKGDVGLGNVDNVQQLPLSYLDTDETLAANSDEKVASQKAIKTYVDNGLTRVSTTTVAFNAVAATTLYTTPTGKLFVPVLAIIRAGADAGETDVTFGRVGALTDWLGTIALDNLDADGDQVKIEVVNNATPVKSKTYAAGVVFQLDVTVANGGATNYVDLFGYLVDA